MKITKDGRKEVAILVRIDLVHWNTIPEDHAVLGLIKLRQQIEQRRLSTAISTDNKYHLSRRDREGHRTDDEGACTRWSSVGVDHVVGLDPIELRYERSVSLIIMG